MKTRHDIRRSQRARFDIVMHHVNESLPTALATYSRLPDIHDRFMEIYSMGGRVVEFTRLAAYTVGDERTNNLSSLQVSLEFLVSFIVAWLRHEAEDDDEVIQAIWAERMRQRLLRIRQPKKYKIVLDHPLPDVRRKFRVLAEEIGEVADAIDKLETASANRRHRAQGHLETELIHVAAVAEAWLEGFEVQS